MKLLFLGAGKMATALATAVVKSNLVPVADILAADPNETARTAFSATTGVSCVPDAAPYANTADVLLVAVKPQVAPQALQALPSLKPSALVISICAGIPIAKISDWTHTRRVIRVMPNTPLMVGEGASCFASGPDATAEDIAFAQSLLGNAGIARQVAEEQLDAVTALSGSGPAYIFEMAKALALAGEAVGLSESLSLDLAIQTILGSAKMLHQRIGSPDELRDAVTSPNGTTYAALQSMKAAEFRTIMRDAVIAARDRSIELGKNQ